MFPSNFYDDSLYRFITSIFLSLLKIFINVFYNIRKFIVSKDVGDLYFCKSSSAKHGIWLWLDQVEFRRVSRVFSIIQKSSYPINLRTPSPIRNLNLINYFKQHTIPCQFSKKKTEGNCIFCTHPIIIKPWGSQLHETDVPALPSYTINFFLMLQKPVILSIFFHKFPKISSSSIL